MLRVHDDWLLTPYRAAVHLPSRTAVIADLHLGYSQARCQRGEALPLNGDAEGLATLHLLREECGVESLIVAGDLTEAGLEATALTPFLNALRRASLRLLAIVPGNHDRAQAGDDHGLPLHPEGITLGDWHIVHGNGKLPGGNCVLGHEHPCLVRRGTRVPCYLVSEHRLVLPAFSRDAAGVSVANDARWQTSRCCGIIRGEVVDFGVLAQLAKSAMPGHGRPRGAARRR